VAAGTPGCTVSGVTYSKAESGVVLRATRTSGNNVAAGTSAAFTVGKANQTIAFAALVARTLGDPAFAVSATASSGLAVAFTSITPAACAVGGTSVTLMAAGSCTVRASQGGDGTFNAAADVDQSFTVSPAGTTTLPPVMVVGSGSSSGGGGGGCTAGSATRIDPTLPMLLLASLGYLARRRLFSNTAGSKMAVSLTQRLQTPKIE
jgi:hypothetical protein